MNVKRIRDVLINPDKHVSQHLTLLHHILTGPTQLRITTPCWHMAARDSSTDTSASMMSMSVFSSGMANERRKEDFGRLATDLIYRSTMCLVQKLSKVSLIFSESFFCRCYIGKTSANVREDTTFELSL